MSKTNMIIEKLAALKYKDDSIVVKDVYPSMLEDMFHFINDIQIIGGRDLDYEGETLDYIIGGSAYYGTCTFTKKRGEERPKEIEENVYTRTSFTYNDREINNVPPAVECSEQDLVELKNRKDLFQYYICFNSYGKSKMTLFYAKDEVDVRRRALSIWGRYDDIKTGEKVEELKQKYADRFNASYTISNKVYVLER